MHRNKLSEHTISVNETAVLPTISLLIDVSLCLQKKILYYPLLWLQLRLNLSNHSYSPIFEYEYFKPKAYSFTKRMVMTCQYKGVRDASKNLHFQAGLKNQKKRKLDQEDCKSWSEVSAMWIF